VLLLGGFTWQPFTRVSNICTAAAAATLVFTLQLQNVVNRTHVHHEAAPDATSGRNCWLCKPIQQRCCYCHHC
jgi:hypothetical protein